ncbi:LHFPL tetraspan subfamily member 2 protein [Pseudolycoriella hygida]|uniref:LHFPL tetraspan subfamily member 2 protein n=1 Tax=Pseudolycoriella hygida TaxID=35572 RepID=A0A9Q0S4N2_9DIPT|nr:LHFPL tetraspan subfamily member 2 protein [Pseudolycoriella hygida]
MCYVIITSGSLTWFILSLLADMVLLAAIVTPKWLIGPERYQIDTNFTTHRYPSVGIYTRCKIMDTRYHCGPFDFDGFATDNEVYPIPWKASMFFMSLGFFILTTTVLLTLLTCCRQSIFGKSIHNITASAQVACGILVMIAVFLHPLGWGAKRVISMCGADSEAFSPADCSIGWSLYCAIAGIVLCFICAGISLKAEKSNMRLNVKRRIESGERIVCIP